MGWETKASSRENTWKTALQNDFIRGIYPNIRRGYDVRHISFLFGVSQSQVTRTFIALVSRLARCLGQTTEWPSKAFVMGNMPKSFSSYPNNRGIIDCTEFKVQNPFRPRAQKAAWSSYKHSNTCKLLVCIMPSGAVTFLSKVYNGAVSDVAIVEKSNFVELMTLWQTKDSIVDTFCYPSELH